MILSFKKNFTLSIDKWSQLDSCVVITEYFEWQWLCLFLCYLCILWSALPANIGICDGIYQYMIDHIIILYYREESAIMKLKIHIAYQSFTVKSSRSGNTLLSLSFTLVLFTVPAWLCFLIMLCVSFDKVLPEFVKKFWNKTRNKFSSLTLLLTEIEFTREILDPGKQIYQIVLIHQGGDWTYQSEVCGVNIIIYRETRHVT